MQLTMQGRMITIMIPQKVLACFVSQIGLSTGGPGRS